MPKRDILFLIYLNRTGSTFLANQLSAHPDLAVAPEGHNSLQRLLGQIEGNLPLDTRLSRLERDLVEDQKLLSWRVNPLLFRQRAVGSRDGLDAFYALCDSFADAHFPDARMVVVKGHFLQDLIIRYGYSGLERNRKVRALFLLRDPRAMYASQRKSLSTRNGKPMQDNPLVAALRWRQATKSAEQLSHAPYGITVRYVDMVVDNKATLGKIASFLGLETAPFGSQEHVQVRRLADMIPEEQRHLHQSIGEKPLSDRVSSWRKSLSVSEVAIVELFAGKAMQRLGYENVSRGIGPSDVFLILRLMAIAIKRRLRRSFRP